MTQMYKLCNRCVMDTSAKDISFDSQGFCNFCSELEITMDSINNKANEYFNLDELVAKIKIDGKGKMYDCIVGVSGGVDSSYTLYKVVKLGLRPLAVHLDNGWNSELAVSNINNLINNLNVDLYTHVIDWRENRDMQLSFFKANVIDIEMIMDNAQAALNFKIAKKYNLHYILSGSNTATEGIRAPQNWTHYKFDVKNIKAIHKKFGSLKIKTHPLISTIDYLIFKKIHKIDWVFFLDYLTYNKTEAINILKQEVDYKPYPYKHYESVFTRFYQGYILPKKFNVDKRRMHLSSLIINGDLSKVDALNLLKQEPYPDQSLLYQDIAYVIKKMGLTKEDFELYMTTPVNEHSDFPSEEGLFKFLLKLSKMFKK